MTRLKMDIANHTLSLASPDSDPSVETFGFDFRSNNTSAPTTPTSDNNRWSDVVPPKAALTFAMMWDPEGDSIAFSGGELLDSDSALGSTSPHDVDYQSSQILTVHPSMMQDSENTATILAFFREHHSFMFSSRTNTLLLPRACQTLASSTLEPEAVGPNLRHSSLCRPRTHYNNRYFTCLEGLDREFSFNPETSFGRMWMQGMKTKSEHIDEDFFETISRSIIADHGHSNPASTIENQSESRLASQVVTVHLFDDSSARWSTVDVPASPALAGFLYGDQERRPMHKRLRKKRPENVPVPPIFVLRRHQYSHDIPPPPCPSPKKPSPPLLKGTGSLSSLPASIPKLIRGLTHCKRSDFDPWVCIEVTEEIIQHDI